MAEFYAGPLDGRTTEKVALLLVQPIFDTNDGRLYKATYRRTSPDRYDYVGMEPLIAPPAD